MEETTNSTQSSSGVNPFVVGGAILIVVVALGAYFLWSMNSGPKTETIKQMPVTPTAVMEATPATSAATITASPSGAMKADATTKSFALETGSYYFTPNKITVKKGDTVQLTITNKGGTHNFSLDEFQVETPLPTGKTTEVTFVASKAGTYEFYCGVGKHRSMGQKGTLIVQ